MATNDTSKNSNSDELISLEALVAESDVSSPPGTATDKIDEILAVEDPEFTAGLEELKAIGAEPVEVEVTPDSELENVVAREKKELGAKGPKKAFLFLVKRPLRKLKELALLIKNFGIWLKVTGLPKAVAGLTSALHAAKAGAGAAAAWIKSVLAAFSALPFKSKLLVVSVALLGGAAVTMTLIAYRGHFLPSFEKNFLLNFGTVAAEKFEIEKDSKWVDLNDPMLHPEHMVSIERIIVNLKPPEDGSNPMGLLDIYLEAGSQEAAVELKDRESEARDVIGRTLEQMSYDELITDEGKNKLKVFIRKNLNDFLTRGRIRRVFFKSIVLKP